VKTGKKIPERLRSVLGRFYCINPITLVVREGKAVRICLDARRINKEMVADRTKVITMLELLQKFHGAKYITSLDLSSAFLQIPLEQFSRQWKYCVLVYHCSLWFQEQSSSIHQSFRKGIGRLWPK
jgi:recombinational DNA repair protein RecR